MIADRELEVVARRVCAALGVGRSGELVAAAVAGPVPAVVAERARERLRATVEAEVHSRRFTGRHRALDVEPERERESVPRGPRELGPGVVRRVPADTLRSQRRERI